MRYALSKFPLLARLVITLLVLITISSCGTKPAKLDLTQSAVDPTDVVIFKGEKCRHCHVALIEKFKDGEREEIARGIKLGELKIDPGTYQISFQVCFAVDLFSQAAVKHMTLHALPGHIYEVDDTGWLSTCVKGLRIIDRTAGVKVWSWKHPKAGGGEVYSQAHIRLAAERKRQEREELAAEAARGDAEAQYQMGSRFDIDKASRREWLRLAAEQGHVEAMYDLGTRSDGGSKEQMHWYCRAAIAGHVEAQFAIGRAYRTASQRDEHDLMMAYLWINASEANGYFEKHHPSQALLKTDGWPCCDYDGPFLVVHKAQLNRAMLENG